MEEVIKTQDTSLLTGKVAVLGYGSQGHAHALNLADSGVEVEVGLRADSSSRAAAEEAGLPVRSVPDAVRGAQVVAMLVPDGPLQDVPFQVLLPQLPPEGNEMERYRVAPWLVRKYDFVTLPGIAALRLLRTQHLQRAGREPVLGFGDPILAPPPDAAHTSNEPTPRGAELAPEDLRQLP